MKQKRVSGFESLSPEMFQVAPMMPGRDGDEAGWGDATKVASTQEMNCEEVEALKEALGELAAEKAQMEQERDADRAAYAQALRRAKEEQTKLEAELKREKDRSATFGRERDEMSERLKVNGERLRKLEEDNGVRGAPALPAGVLKAPGVEEMFAGEMREMVLASLAEAKEQAEKSSRGRRAMILSLVLEANPPSGELARRRNEVRQILKDSGSFTDESTIAALGRLGVKLISGRKHWKLEYGEQRVVLSKTPSDFRSQLNATSQLGNLWF